MARTKLLLVLACLCAAAVAAQPAQARKFSTYYTKFEISIQGRLTEKWSKTTTHGTGYGCPAREEAAGGTTIRFATEKPYKLTAGVYGGWHGRPPVKITDDRFGQSRNLAADGSATDCGGLRPASDGSACGHREWTASLTLFNTSKFGFNFPVDDPRYPFECPYPAKPATWGSDDYWDTGYVIGRYDSGVDWMRKVLSFKCDRHGRHCKPPKTTVVIHNVKHVSLPYANPSYPGAFQGDYTADIDWTAKIHRLEKLHTG
jgi:hypothetical protein